MKISVVTSLYRSAPYLEELHRRITSTIASMAADQYEIIFVNDGSPDDDLAVARRLAAADPHLVVIDLSRNFGQHSALMTGVRQASGDLVYVLDSDLEEEPEWMAQFHTEMIRTGCDVAFGINVAVAAKGGMPYRVGRRLFYSTLKLLSGVKFPEDVCTARLMTRRYVDALLEYGEREMFLAGIWHMVGFSQLPIAVRKIQGSTTTYTLPRLIALFVNGVTSFSTRPLVAVAVSGVVLSLIAVAFTGWIVVRQLFYGVATEGWASVMAGVLLVGGASMFFNGLIAIYVAKIFLEVKKRPLTTIREIYRGESSGDGRSG
jgi:putative glycosyltransferase